MTYEEYYNQWEVSPESRCLQFDEWLCLRLNRQRQDMIDKACELFRKECQEANGLIKSVCDRNIGDLINVDASVKSFRKAMEE